jgi:Fibrobacter succinogenes major domain (Fib_succ_major)
MKKIAQVIFVSILILVTSCLTSCEKKNDLPTDGDGNKYHTVVIGTQTWLKENLKTTKYCGGAPISLVTDNLKWENCKVAAYCWYDNNAGLKDLYGALYNWYVVKAGVLCPVGYHVPTIEDWTTLATYLSDVPQDKPSFGAISIGMRVWNGDFILLSSWWVSAQEESEKYAWRATVDFSLSPMPKATGYSVRCIKDN